MKESPFTQSEMTPLFGNEHIYYRNVFLDPTPYYRTEDTVEAREVQRQVNWIFVSICLVIGAISLGIHVAKNLQPIPDRAILDLKINKYPV